MTQILPLGTISRNIGAQVASIVASLIVCLCLAGCGEDTATPKATQQDPDAGHVDPDGDDHNNGLESDGLPAYITLTATPARAVYAPDAVVTLSAKVFDRAGVEVSGHPVQWSVSPAASVEDEGSGRWKLVAEGDIQFDACAAPASPATSPEICAARTLIVDAGPPELIVHSPSPGDQLHDLASIEVRGTVSDARPNVHVFVNGARAQVDTEGDFTAYLTPHFGINHIEVVASDGLHGTPATVNMDVLWAPHYHVTSDPDSESTSLGFGFDDGLMIRMGQNFFDDGQDLVVVPEMDTITHDLADILSLILANIDLTDQIPDPIIESSGFTLRITDLVLGTPDVEFDVIDGGLELYMRVHNMQAFTEGNLTLGDETLNLNGSLAAKLSILARISVEKPSADEPFVVEMESFQLAIDGTEPRFASPAANAIFELAEGALRGTLEGIIMATVETSFVGTLPELLLDIFMSIDNALGEQAIDLDLGLGRPLTLDFKGRIGELLTQYRHGLDAVVQTDIGVVSDAYFPDNLGVPLMEPIVSKDPFFATSRIQVGLRMGLLNGILHTLWNAGLLEIDVAGILPADIAGVVEAGSLSGKLPPVISPPLRGEPHDVIITLGQLELELQLRRQTDKYGVSIGVGASITLDDNALKLELAEEPIIKVWVIESTEDSPFLSADILRQLVLNELWPQLESGLSSSLSFALPIPDLGNIVGFVPALDSFDLQLILPRPTAVREGYIILDAALEGVLPHL